LAEVAALEAAQRADKRRWRRRRRDDAALEDRWRIFAECGLNLESEAMARALDELDRRLTGARAAGSAERGCADAPGGGGAGLWTAPEGALRGAASRKAPPRADDAGACFAAAPLAGFAFAPAFYAGRARRAFVALGILRRRKTANGRARRPFLARWRRFARGFAVLIAALGRARILPRGADTIEEQREGKLQQADAPPAARAAAMAACGSMPRRTKPGRGGASAALRQNRDREPHRRSGRHDGRTGALTTAARCAGQARPGRAPRASARRKRSGCLRRSSGRHRKAVRPPAEIEDEKRPAGRD
jgi:hypothetical protein